jgi:hypothetical protein
MYLRVLVIAGKGKVVPLQATDGAWGQKRYSSCSFLTSVPEGGEWWESRPGRALPPGKENRTRSTVGWAKPVRTQRLQQKSCRCRSDLSKSPSTSLVSLW